MGADKVKARAVPQGDMRIRDAIMGACLAAAFVIGVSPARAQDSQATIALEQMSIEDRVARLETMFDQQRGGMIVLQDRQRASHDQVVQISERIARGDQPLVAFEIEQLWTFVNALEKENAELRERLQAVEAGGQ